MPTDCSLTWPPSGGAARTRTLSNSTHTQLTAEHARVAPHAHQPIHLPFWDACGCELQAGDSPRECSSDASTTALDRGCGLAMQLGADTGDWRAVVVERQAERGPTREWLTALIQPNHPRIHRARMASCRPRGGSLERRDGGGARE
jgi:hypothetical protein